MKSKNGALMKRLVKFIIFVILIILLIQYIPSFIAYLFPRSYNAYIELNSEKYGVDKNLIYAVIKAESNFDREAQSHKGAKGLMQLTDDTAAWCADELGIDEYDVLNVGTNIEIGTYYLSYLIDKCGGNEQNAIAAYNAGHGNVEKWLRNPEYSKDGKTLTIIPFKETETYVKKVEFYKKIYAWQNNK